MSHHLSKEASLLCGVVSQPLLRQCICSSEFGRKLNLLQMRELYERRYSPSLRITEIILTKTFIGIKVQRQIPTETLQIQHPTLPTYFMCFPGMKSCHRASNPKSPSFLFIQVSFCPSVHQCTLDHCLAILFSEDSREWDLLHLQRQLLYYNGIKISYIYFIIDHITVVFLGERRQPTQYHLPGKSQGWRSLVGYSPVGLQEFGR